MSEGLHDIYEPSKVDRPESRPTASRHRPHNGAVHLMARRLHSAEMQSIAFFFPVRFPKEIGKHSVRLKRALAIWISCR